MGLDVYAGPLTRYYVGDWKTAVQAAAEASGIDVRVVYAGGEPKRPTPDEASRAVADWQRALRNATGIPQLAWTDTPDGQYLTDKADWDGYWALLFLAAADEFPDVPPPAEVPPPSRLGDPSRHALWKRVEHAYEGRQPSGLRRLFGGGKAEIPGPRRFLHLLHQQELWLPVDFEHPFTGPDAGGNPVSIGSAPRLLRELEGLNERTFGADADLLADWRRRGPSEDDFRLRRVAEFGLAVFLEITRFAVERRVPIRLDY